MWKMKTILVPTDFTPVGDNALRYGEFLARYLNAKIVLLHIVDDQEDVPEAKRKLLEVAQKYKNDYNIEIVPEVRIGSIFEDITNCAAEVEASLVVMGTHGMRGIQKLIGSYAMRVIKDSTIPFVVVQKKPPPPTIKNILVPVDLTAETKIKFSVISEISSVFKTNLKIVYPLPLNKEEEVRIKANLAFAKRFFSNTSNPFEIIPLETSKGFVEAIIEFAHNNECHLIGAVNTFEGEFIPLFGLGIRDIQKLIQNEYEIPVLVVNYKHGKSTLSIFQM